VTTTLTFVAGISKESLYPETHAHLFRMVAVSHSGCRQSKHNLSLQAEERYCYWLESYTKRKSLVLLSLQLDSAAMHTVRDATVLIPYTSLKHPTPRVSTRRWIRCVEERLSETSLLLF
jgi:hypothetical protein